MCSHTTERHTKLTAKELLERKILDYFVGPRSKFFFEVLGLDRFYI